MRKISIKYGLYMLGGFVAFFLTMHLIGLSDNIWLRIFNGVIHLSLIYLAIKDYRATQPSTVNNYISGVATGMYASVYGVIGFSVFMLLFFLGNPAFLEQVQAQVPLDRYFTPLSATFFILVEGIATSLIGSYILTRLIDMQIERSQPGTKYEAN